MKRKLFTLMFYSMIIFPSLARTVTTIEDKDCRLGVGANLYPESFAREVENSIMEIAAYRGWTPIAGWVPVQIGYNLTFGAQKGSGVFDWQKLIGLYVDAHYSENNTNYKEVFRDWLDINLLNRSFYDENQNRQGHYFVNAVKKYLPNCKIRN